jgi:hypothetical protein
MPREATAGSVTRRVPVANVAREGPWRFFYSHDGTGWRTFMLIANSARRSSGLNRLPWLRTVSAAHELREVQRVIESKQRTFLRHGMGIWPGLTSASAVRCDEDRLTVDLMDGRTSCPLVIRVCFTRRQSNAPGGS